MPNVKTRRNLFLGNVRVLNVCFFLSMASDRGGFGRWVDQVDGGQRSGVLHDRLGLNDQSVCGIFRVSIRAMTYDGRILGWPFRWFSAF